MHILMFDNEFPPLGGGTGVVNFHFLEELAKCDDISVDLITSSRTRSNYETEQFTDRIFIHKVPVNNQDIHHSSNFELLRYAWRGFFFSRRLMRQRKYDVGFAYAGVPAGCICYLLNRINGLPYLVSLQGTDVPGFEHRYNYLYPFLKPVLRKVWNRAGAVVALNNQMVELAQQTLSQSQFPIVPNAVDTKLFHPRTQNVGTTKEINILCVGRLIERKGQANLLRAFAELKRHHHQQVRLTLVGKGDSEGSLRRLANSLKIEDAVTFVGFVARKDMPAVYHSADIFVLPSFSEGMSIGLLEAMASALPVVVTSNGGVDQLITNGENGFIVAWDDVPALTDALDKLVTTRTLWTKMGCENRRIAEQFSWPKYTERYLEYCRFLISSRNQN